MNNPNFPEGYFDDIFQTPVPVGRSVFHGNATQWWRANGSRCSKSICWWCFDPTCDRWLSWRVLWSGCLETDGSGWTSWANYSWKIWWRWGQPCCLRACCPWDWASGFGLSVSHVCSIITCHASDLFIWQWRTKAKVFAQISDWRDGWMFRLNWAWFWIRSGWHGNKGGKNWWWLSAVWVKNVDLERTLCRYCNHLGQTWGCYSWFHRWTCHGWRRFQHTKDRRQAIAARFSDRFDPDG